MFFGRTLTFEWFREIEQKKSTLPAVSLWHLVGFSALRTKHIVETIISLEKFVRMHYCWWFMQISIGPKSTGSRVAVEGYGLDVPLNFSR
jgi:hypothetical protein